MTASRVFGAAVAAAALLLSAACSGQVQGASHVGASAPLPRTQVTVHTRTGPHQFDVEIARTSAEQARGLMYRTDIPANGGMLFAPYPGDGGPPREARFWMKDTPTSLDILFIRPDGTIATIADHAMPFSEDLIPSGEPVSGVLEINAGKAAELGIAPGDKVTWPGQKR